MGNGMSNFFQKKLLMITPTDPNTLRPRQNGRHFADDIFKCIFLNKNVWIPIKISMKFVPKGPINNIPALVQIMAWRRPGDKPLSEPMMVSLTTHICATWPQWVKMGFMWHVIWDTLVLFTSFYYNSYKVIAIHLNWVPTHHLKKKKKNQWSSGVQAPIQGLIRTINRIDIPVVVFIIATGALSQYKDRLSRFRDSYHNDFDVVTTSCLSNGDLYFIKQYLGIKTNPVLLLKNVDTYDSQVAFELYRSCQMSTCLASQIAFINYSLIQWISKLLTSS